MMPLLADTFHIVGAYAWSAKAVCPRTGGVTAWSVPANRRFHCGREEGQVNWGKGYSSVVHRAVLN